MKSYPDKKNRYRIYNRNVNATSLSWYLDNQKSAFSHNFQGGFSPLVALLREGLEPLNPTWFVFMIDTSIFGIKF